MLKNKRVVKKRISVNIKWVCFIVISLFSIKPSFSQTSLSPGDMAIIAFKTSTGTDPGNDAVKIVTLVDLQCNTKFIVTDNNWSNTAPGWCCPSNEFAVEITCNTAISAGSVFYIDCSASGAAANCSGGAVTRVDLAGLWGTDYGLSSGGDNVYLLQGTRAAPQFIFAVKNGAGAFANAGAADCDKSKAGLPTHASLGIYTLSIGFSAAAMPSSQDQWHYNCVTHNGTKAAIRNAIATTANWVSTNNQSWDNQSGIFTVTTGMFPYGVLAVSGANCGCLANCNLKYYGGAANCGAGVGGDCTAGYQNMSANIVVPAGCTYQITAEMKPRENSCSSSGADGNCQTCDVLKVDVLAGVKIFQQGTSNASLIDSYTLVGPGTIVVSGKANRADEIITYGIKTTPCACLVMVLPVELSAFNAQKIDQSVQLTWSTVSERDNSYFTVERSIDAIAWESIYIIGGQGSSSIPYNYSIFDSSPQKGVLYYRLKQTDKDERFSYSRILSVNTGEELAKLLKRVNIYGQEVDENTTGIIILIYDNGQTKKIIK